MKRKHLEIELQSRAASRIRTGNAERPGRAYASHRRQSLAQLGLLAVGLLLVLGGCDSHVDEVSMDQLKKMLQEIRTTTFTAEEVAEFRARKSTVVLISMDGVGNADLDRVELLSLDDFEVVGARGALRPVYPTTLYPTHASIATGAWPSKHGIVGNVFVDPVRGRFDMTNEVSWYESEPIWVAAERQGIRTAVFSWPGNRLAYHGIEPSFRIEEKDEGLHERVRVAKIAEWLSMPEETRPQLIVCYFRGTDAAAHRFGPGAEETLTELKLQEAQLRRIEGMMTNTGHYYYTTLIVVSGHGLGTADELIDIGSPLRAAGIDVETAYAGGSAFLRLADKAQIPRAIALLDALPNVSAHSGKGLPSRLNSYHPARSADITLVTHPPYSLWDPGPEPERPIAPRMKHPPKGMHGYLPDEPNMQGIFLALGRGVKPGLRPQVHAIDVAPTIAALLGIRPPDGSTGQVVLDPEFAFPDQDELLEIIEATAPSR